MPYTYKGVFSSLESLDGRSNKNLWLLILDRTSNVPYIWQTLDLIPG